MVQGTSHDYFSGKSPAQGNNFFDKTSKKSGYEAIQKYQQDKKDAAAKKDAWGPVFKDKNHFSSLHHC